MLEACLVAEVDLPRLLKEANRSRLVAEQDRCVLQREDIVVGGGGLGGLLAKVDAVSYTHLRAHETVLDLVCRLLLEKKKHNQ